MYNGTVGIFIFCISDGAPQKNIARPKDLQLN